MPTRIEWCDETWNPIVGCSRVSKGCDNCYAIGVAHRGMSEHHRGLTIGPAESGTGRTDWNGTINRAPDSIFLRPLSWKRPCRIFVNSLSDLFHRDVPLSTIEEVLAVIACSPHHTFMLLTKRPHRMREVMSYSLRGGMVAGAAQQMGLSHLLPDVTMKDFWPLPNLWLGVSIESNASSWRVNHLRVTPAAVRWVSVEPLLGPVDELDLTRIDWVVAGGESGPGSRPMHPQWVRDLRDRCIDECAHVGHWPGGEVGIPGAHDGDDAGEPCDRPAFLFKQWGDWLGFGPDVLADSYRLAVTEGKPHKDWRDGGTITGAAVRVGKKAAGRELDGRTWDEYPDRARP